MLALEVMHGELCGVEDAGQVDGEDAEVGFGWNFAVEFVLCSWKARSATITGEIDDQVFARSSSRDGNWSDLGLPGHSSNTRKR